MIKSLICLFWGHHFKSIGRIRKPLIPESGQLGIYYEIVCGNQGKQLVTYNLLTCERCGATKHI